MSSYPYQEFEFVVTASGSSSILTFEALISNPDSFIFLDDVSVRTSIIRNGNFENGSLPWSSSGSVSFSLNTFFSHGGDHYALLPDNVVGNGTLEQSLNTSQDTIYELSYWLWKPESFGDNDSFRVEWNGSEIIGSALDKNNPSGGGKPGGPFGLPYINFKFRLTANFSTSTLKFIFNVEKDYGYFLIDDISMVRVDTVDTGVICFSGNSLILTKNILTQEIKEIPARKVLSDRHLVYSTADKEFIPIKYNIVTGPTTEYYLIRKNLLGENEPFDDLYVTAGHTILYKGIYTKAKNIPGSTKVHVKPENVYSICTDKKKLILVNGLQLLTWGFDDWIERANKKNLKWSDNNISPTNNTTEPSN
ncbi:MAG: hypothetical protein QW303_08230 [Nitrososphaerota archaeon]